MTDKLIAIIENDISEADWMLLSMLAKLGKEGPEAVVALGTGVGQVAGLLANRLGISAPDALGGHHLSWGQLDEVARDLARAMQEAKRLLNSEVQSVRLAAQKQTAGCLMMYHLYRLLFVATTGPETHRAKAAERAEKVGQYVRLLAEIGAGIRPPSDALIIW